MKPLFLALIILGFATTSNSQITKGNWLLGGGIKFSSINSRGNFNENTTVTTEINGNAGYFLIDKLVAGLKPDIYLSNYKNNSYRDIQTRMSIGPFLRYYFLPTEQTVNLFIEGGYALGVGKVSQQNAVYSNSFSFSSGTVFFLNSAVGIELSVGYSQQNFNGDLNNKNSTIQAGVGFQFYLEKD